MKPIAVVGAITVALAAALVGCSSGSPESSDPAALPLSDFADGSSYSFGTPSGQIQCRVVQEAGLACQTQGHPHTVGDSALCGFYPGIEQGRAVRFGYFDERKQPCATIIQGEGYDSPHTLADGRSVTAELSSGLVVTCTSANDGLTCTQAGETGPRGFFLSVDSFTVL